jgi:hypothetical protein
MIIGSGQLSVVARNTGTATMRENILIWAVIYLLLVSVHSAEAQQHKKVPRIGILSAATPATVAHLLEEFKHGLNEHGYKDRMWC